MFQGLYEAKSLYRPNFSKTLATCYYTVKFGIPYKLSLILNQVCQINIYEPIITSVLLFFPVTLWDSN